MTRQRSDLIKLLGHQLIDNIGNPEIIVSDTEDVLDNNTKMA
jgi:hypothetical protein